MCVCIYGQVTIDVGEAGGSFFATIFAKLAQTELDDCLFERSLQNYDLLLRLHVVLAQ